MARLIFAVACCLVSLVFSPFARAETGKPLQICVDSAKGTITARVKCSKKELKLSTGSLANIAEKPAFNPLTCYWRLGTATDLSGPARQVTIKTMCDANDVAMSHAFEHNELNSIVGVSSIAFKTVVGATHPLPQGVEYRVNVSTAIPSGTNIAGEVDVLCCKYPVA